MENNKIAIILLGAILAVGLCLLIVSLQLEVKPQVNVNVPGQELGGAEDLTRIADGVYSTSTAVSTNATGTEVLAADSSIAYRRLQNTGPSVITCNLDSATSTLGWEAGITLNTSGADSIYEQYLGYWGAIRCTATGTAGQLSVVEY